MDDFINVVKAQIESRDVSMSELARSAECSRPYLYRVLAGDQVPTLAWASKVAAALGIRLKFEKIS